MKKKLLIFVLCLLMVVPVLAGCASFPVDPVKYYNAVVATVGDTEITRSDLLSAYNSYGYSTYVSSQGQTVNEALDSTLQFLIKREMIVQYAETETLSGSSVLKYALNDYEINEMFVDVVEYIDSIYEQYETTAREKLGRETTDPTTDSETTKYTLSKYEKRAILTKLSPSNTVEKVEYIPEDLPTTADDPVLATTYFAQYRDFETIARALYEQYAYYCDDAEVYAKAEGLLLNQLISNERYKRDAQGNPLSTDKDEVFIREFQRAYENAYQNAMISKVRTVYLQNEEISTDYLIRKFRSLYKTDYTKYSLSTSDYASAMKSDASAVLYHPDDGDQFFYVYHILLQFADGQDDLYESYKTQYNDGDNGVIDETTYNNYLAQLKSAVPVKLRDSEGNQTETTYTVADIENMVKNQVVGTDGQKLSAFIDLMYQYNEDPGMFTSTTPYAIGFENSSMVDEFNAVARELAEDDVYGAVSEAFVSSYGYHIMFYAGKITNKFNIGEIDSNALNLTKLNGMYVNELTEYTYFDWLFDKVYPADTDEVYSTNNGYSDYEDDLADTLSNIYNPTINKKVLKTSTKL